MISFLLGGGGLAGRTINERNYGVHYNYLLLLIDYLLLLINYLLLLNLLLLI